jgi:DNA-binding MarR family transcriptional regulator/predicted GNAT family N-acyltransferase
MTASLVERVRAFNRIVTERVGALDEQYLGRGRPLGASRMLWEIGPGGSDVRELRRRLGLDSGYASRLLRALEAEGLVAVETAAADRRVKRARLTEAGEAECAELDRMSDELALSILEPLDEHGRARLATSMQEVERLLLASLIAIEAEDPASDDARWCLEQYFTELAQRFDGGFDPGLSIPAGADDLTPPAGLLLVARSRGRPVGCGALKFHGREPAELKRMWVSPDARGLGLGRRLLRCLEEEAREAGARIVRLETNGSLREAIALYRSAGYSEVDAFNDEPYAHHWFEKRLASACKPQAPRHRR